MKLFATLLALAAFSLIAQGVGKYFNSLGAMPQAARAGALRPEPAAQSQAKPLIPIAGEPQ